MNSVLLFLLLLAVSRAEEQEEVFSPYGRVHASLAELTNEVVDVQEEMRNVDRLLNDDEDSKYDEDEDENIFGDDEDLEEGRMTVIKKPAVVPSAAHHIPDALGNTACASCQQQRYTKCFVRQAESAQKRDRAIFPDCDKDAQLRCQIPCWDHEVAVDDIREKVWAEFNFCVSCRSHQAQQCLGKWQTEEQGEQGKAACYIEAENKCKSANWCPAPSKKAAFNDK